MPGGGWVERLFVLDENVVLLVIESLFIETSSRVSTCRSILVLRTPVEIVRRRADCRGRSNRRSAVYLLERDPWVFLAGDLSGSSISCDTRVLAPP